MNLTHPQPFEGPVKVVASSAELPALPAVMKNLKIELGGKVQENVHNVMKYDRIP